MYYNIHQSINQSINLLWTGKLPLPLLHLHAAGLLPLHDEQVAVEPQRPRPRLLTDRVQHHAVLQRLQFQRV